MIYTFIIAIEGPFENEGIIDKDTLGKILADLEEVVAKKGYALYDSFFEED